MLTFEEITGQPGLKQWDLTRRVHKQALSQVSETDLCRSAHRASLGIDGAKDWLTCRPSPGLMTHTDDADFRLWMKFHCGVRICNDNAPCPRQGCDAILDPFGDHLLTCHHRVSPGNAPMHWRHDSMVAVLAATLRRASRNAEIEPHRAPEPDRKRPDIKTEGTTGGEDYLDISIHHPLAGSSQLLTIVTSPKSILSKAANKKRAKYHKYISEIGPTATLYPISITSLGGAKLLQGSLPLDCTQHPQPEALRQRGRFRPCRSPARGTQLPHAHRRHNYRDIVCPQRPPLFFMFEEP